MDLVKYVKSSGGDYTDPFTAFTDMLSSGLAATGNITSYLMLVEGGSYTGSFSGYIPYSGSFVISASGVAILNFNATSDASGIYITNEYPNLTLQNFVIDCSGLNSAAFSVSPNFALSLENLQFVECTNGISVSDDGALKLQSVSSSGPDSGNFVYGSGYIVLDGAQLSNYNNAISGNYISLSESTLANNTNAVVLTTPANSAIDNTLIYGSTYGIYSYSGVFSVSYSTIKATVPIFCSGDYMDVESSILYGDTICVDGHVSSGSIVQNSATYPSGWALPSALSGVNLATDDPKFNNTAVGDYRLYYGAASGSIYVEHTPDSILSSGVEIEISQAQFRVTDKLGEVNYQEFLPFVYIQGSTVLFSDHNREIKLANTIGSRTGLTYQQLATAKFSEYNVLTSPSFALSDSQTDLSPWDWDWKSIKTTQIDKDTEYLVPRSIVDIDDIVKYNLGEIAASVSWTTLTKRHIKVYDQVNYKGIAYDSNISDFGISYIWVLDGSNQTLIKQNAFSGQNVEEYPLLCGSLARYYVRPSGLVYVAPEGDKYRYIHSKDPSLEILAPSQVTQENGSFAPDLPWIPTHMNNMVDLRGVVAFKDHIFITGTQYYETITDRTVVPSGDGLGLLYWYSNNDLFYHYTRRESDTGGPQRYSLALTNKYPTDISVYEDGTLFIADAANLNMYRYKPAYDYALVQNSYDNETKVLLRERYQDINIKES